MKLLRKRLTYANVMSSIAVFLVLGGATAFAATQLAKNSVGTKQLKKNAVTTAKIKKNAVTAAKVKANAIVTAKIKNGAVNGAKIADGSITGAEINSTSTAFSQAVARLRAPGSLNLDVESLTPIGSYVQPAGETDQWVPGATVTFAPGCTAPRSAEAYLIYNPVDPNNPNEGDIIALGFANDQSGALPTAQMKFATVELGQLASMAPTGPLSHAFYLYSGGVDCNAGDGATATNVGVDVIGTK